jgi:WD40-like Beta Propeller Repeat/HYR domain
LALLSLEAKTTIAYSCLIVVIGVAIFASGFFMMLPISESAFGTIQEENGKIVFVSNRDGNNEIYVMNADGSGQIRLTKNAAHDGFPSLSPDGEKVAFESNRDGNFEIYVMNAADGSNQRRLTNNLAVDWFPSWSPDGTKIAIAFDSTREGNREIYVMNAADGSNPTRLTNNPASDSDPSWSPDGEKIAFVSNRDERGDNNYEIYVMNAADGSEQTNISNSPAYEADPDFGPAAVTEPPPEEDTTPPVITAPDDITVEATGPNGALVSFEVSAEDDVDGPTDVSCDHNSGETFPIGETVVTCTAEDLAGNSAEESFTITVQDTTAPEVEITKAVDKKGVAIAEGSTTKSHYIQITFEATDAVGVDNTECSLDGQAFASCTSPVVYDHLKKGTHEVTVRATDAAGNTGEDQFTWTVNPAEAAKAKPR